MKRILPHIILWLLGSVSILTGQAPHCTLQPISEIYHQSRPLFIEQAADGYLWVGTEHGLFRFNGEQYQPFLLDESGRTDQAVTSFFACPDGRHWVGFQSGAVYYLDHLLHWQLWEPEEGLPTAPITGFQYDGNGTFWIATYGEGVYGLFEGRLYNFNADDGLPANDVYFIEKDTSGEIWVGTDGGLSRLRIDEHGKAIKNITRTEGLPDDIAKAMVVDAHGRFWVGLYDGGFCRYDPLAGVFSLPVPDWEGGVILDMELIAGQELWIATEGSGLWRYDLQSRHLFRIRCEHHLQSGKILDLHQDREGNLWVVSSNDGVIRINRHFAFLSAEGLNIQAILAGNDDDLWLGTQEGLYRWAPGSERLRTRVSLPGPAALNIISLYEDPSGNIWIGTFGEGVYVYHPGSGRVRHLTEADGLTNGSILSIAGLGDQLWLATLGGVTAITVKEDPFHPDALHLQSYQQESGLGSNFVYTVFIDRKGRPWFGTDGQGVSWLEDGIIRNAAEAVLADGDTIQLEAVYSITEDQDGLIWLSTAQEGVFRFDGRRFAHFGLEEGLTDLSVTSLVSDQNGNILVIHPDGVDLLNPKTSQVRSFGEESGLRGIDPNLNVAAPNRQGHIWLGSREGVIKYTAMPETVAYAPRTILNQVSVFLEPVDFSEVQTFRYDQNNLLFEYIGLWYSAPQKVIYRYQLEGFDLDWIYSRDRQATYSNLPPGSYTFKVAASVDGHFENEEMATYRFRIRAPLWLQPWFIMISVFLTGLLLYAVIRTREMRLQRETLLKKEKVESQFEALKSQINPHFLFNSFNTLITIIEEDTSLAVEYVEKLSDFYRSILQYREKEVISLSQEIELIRHYEYLLKKRFGDNLHLAIAVNGKEGYVAPLTLQVLVENAVKHNVISRSHPLRIEVYLTGEDYLVVSNNLQPKMTVVRSTYFGLQSISRRYELLSDRKIRIDQTDQVFQVSIPLIKNGDS